MIHDLSNDLIGDEDGVSDDSGDLDSDVDLRGNVRICILLKSIGYCRSRACFLSILVDSFIYFLYT